MAKPKTKTAYESIREYEKANYAVYQLKFPKSAKEQLKALAAAEGQSLNRYILEAVEQRSGLKLTLDNALPWISTSETKK